MARIAGIDLPKQKKAYIGLTYIYGIGQHTALEILQKANVDAHKKVLDLTEEEVEITLQNAFHFMNSNGCFRIAVPDKNHPNPNYIEYVRPGGSGPGCDDHWSFWSFESISGLAKKIGFKSNLIEYYDGFGKLHSVPIDDEKGIIKRSVTKSSTNATIPDYSSLIVDLIKP